MKTIKKLNIEDKPEYFVTNMTNINDFDPNLSLINEIKTLKVDQQCLKLVIVKKIINHMLFLITKVE